MLRYRAQLDYLIEHYSGRRQKLDPEVRIALRMGIYQLRYLERIPAHAAVTESVELVKRARKRSAAGFVNAVLRQVDRDPVAWPDREIELSCPEWLLARWERQYGAEAAEGIARAALAEPVKYTAPAAASRISARNPSCRCCAWSPARRSSISAPRPATRPRRRWNPACAPSPATCTSTASRSSAA